jgi:hypothetical protein
MIFTATSTGNSPRVPSAPFLAEGPSDHSNPAILRTNPLRPHRCV